MKLRAVFCLSAMASVLVACTSARSSLYSDSDAKVSLPPARYSAEAIGAMFERPMTPAQLLRNLKLAVDQDLFVEPGFFTDGNLLKFFDANGIRREPGSESPRRFGQSEAFLTTSDPLMPGMSVQVEQGLIRLGGLDRARESYGGPIRRFAYVHMDVEQIPEMTVGAVRDAFGQETGTQIGGGWASDGGAAPRTAKGRLLYGSTAEFFGLSEQKEISFVIKLPPPHSKDYERTPRRVRDSTIYDSDEIAGIFIYVPQP